MHIQQRLNGPISGFLIGAAVDAKGSGVERKGCSDECHGPALSAAVSSGALIGHFLLLVCVERCAQTCVQVLSPSFFTPPEIFSGRRGGGGGKR